MQGCNFANQNTSQTRDTTGNAQGIIQRAFEHILEAVAATKDYKFLLRTSYIEIYNDEIHDLLAPSSNNNNKSAEGHTRLDFKRTGGKTHSDGDSGDNLIEGLTIVNVRTLDDCLRVVRMGLKNRSVSTTLMNSGELTQRGLIPIERTGNSIEE